MIRSDSTTSTRPSRTLALVLLACLAALAASGCGGDDKQKSGSKGGSKGDRAEPRVKVRVKPKRDRTLPYRYTARGRVMPPSGTSAPEACGAGGKVSIQTKRRSSTISTRRAKLTRSCKFKVSTKFTLPRRLGKTPSKLKLTARFTGNPRLLPAEARPVRFTVG